MIRHGSNKLKIFILSILLLTLSGCALKSSSNSEKEWHIVPVSKDYFSIPNDLLWSFNTTNKSINVYSKCISGKAVYSFNAGKFMGNFNVKEVDGCFMDAQKIAIDKLFSMLKDGVVLKGNKINDTILIEKYGEVKLKLIRGI
ncbi:type III secretion system pilotin MxiM [Shigella flexneri]|nr:type III secretion system pilotin MxiM [Shigella flexneri]ELD5337819.1 type III secretion system pilotin MxiM [Shigella flexneri]ELP3238934.1 type III secretion system pilotin MxiM [Escherichia coli]ELQ5376298.1 type III secretion system pilotin MxiM [Shigella flexneri]